MPQTKAINIDAEIKANITRGIETLPKEAAHMRPIMVSMRDHGLSVIALRQGSKFYKLQQFDDKHPLLVIVGDDLLTSRGPIAFGRTTLSKILKSATHIAVMAATADVAVYEAAVVSALAFQSVVVIIETQPYRQEEWLNFIKDVRGNHKGVLLHSSKMSTKHPSNVINRTVHQ